MALVVEPAKVTAIGAAITDCSDNPYNFDAANAAVDFNLLDTIRDTILGKIVTEASNYTTFQLAADKTAKETAAGVGPHNTDNHTTEFIKIAELYVYQYSSLITLINSYKAKYKKVSDFNTFIATIQGYIDKLNPGGDAITVAAAAEAGIDAAAAPPRLAIPRGPRFTAAAAAAAAAAPGRPAINTYGALLDYYKTTIEGLRLELIQSAATIITNVVLSADNSLDSHYDLTNVIAIGKLSDRTIVDATEAQTQIVAAKTLCDNARAQAIAQFNIATNSHAAAQAAVAAAPAGSPEHAAAALVVASTQARLDIATANRLRANALYVHFTTLRDTVNGIKLLADLVGARGLVAAEEAAAAITRFENNDAFRDTGADIRGAVNTAAPLLQAVIAAKDAYEAAAGAPKVAAATDLTEAIGELHDAAEALGESYVAAAAAAVTYATATKAAIDATVAGILGLDAIAANKKVADAYRTYQAAEQSISAAEADVRTAEEAVAAAESAAVRAAEAVARRAVGAAAVATDAAAGVTEAGRRVKLAKSALKEAQHRRTKAKTALDAAITANPAAPVSIEITGFRANPPTTIEEDITAAINAADTAASCADLIRIAAGLATRIHKIALECEGISTSASEEAAPRAVLGDTVDQPISDYSRFQFNIEAYHAAVTAAGFAGAPGVGILPDMDTVFTTLSNFFRNLLNPVPAFPTIMQRDLTPVANFLLTYQKLRLAQFAYKGWPEYVLRFKPLMELTNNVIQSAATMDEINQMQRRFNFAGTFNDASTAFHAGCHALRQAAESIHGIINGYDGINGEDDILKIYNFVQEYDDEEEELTRIFKAFAKRADELAEKVLLVRFDAVNTAATLTAILAENRRAYDDTNIVAAKTYADNAQITRVTTVAALAAGAPALPPDPDLVTLQTKIGTMTSLYNLRKTIMDIKLAHKTAEYHFNEGNDADERRIITNSMRAALGAFSGGRADDGAKNSIYDHAFTLNTRIRAQCPYLQKYINQSLQPQAAADVPIALRLDRTNKDLSNPAFLAVLVRFLQDPGLDNLEPRLLPSLRLIYTMCQDIEMTGARRFAERNNIARRDQELVAYRDLKTAVDTADRASETTRAAPAPDLTALRITFIEQNAAVLTNFDDMFGTPDALTTDLIRGALRATFSYVAHTVPFFLAVDQSTDPSKNPAYMIMDIVLKLLRDVLDPLAVRLRNALTSRDLIPDAAALYERTDGKLSIDLVNHKNVLLPKMYCDAVDLLSRAYIELYKYDAQIKYFKLDVIHAQQLRIFRYAITRKNDDLRTAARARLLQEPINSDFIRQLVTGLEHTIDYVSQFKDRYEVDNDALVNLPGPLPVGADVPTLGGNRINDPQIQEEFTTVIKSITTMFTDSRAKRTEIGEFDDKIRTADLFVGTPKTQDEFINYGVALIEVPPTRPTYLTPVTPAPVPLARADIVVAVLQAADEVDFCNE